MTPTNLNNAKANRATQEALTAIKTNIDTAFETVPAQVTVSALRQALEPLANGTAETANIKIAVSAFVTTLKGLLTTEITRLNTEFTAL